MKYLPLLAVLAIGSFSGLTFAQSAPAGIEMDSRFMRDAKEVAKAILFRINEVSGGVDNIGAIREGHTSVVGYYNMKGAIAYTPFEGDNMEAERIYGFNWIPFEIELRTDGSKVIRVSIVEINSENEGGIVRKFKAFEYSFDDRNPNIKVSEIRAMSIELAASVFKKGDSWVGPVLDADIGSQFRTYNLNGTSFPRPYPNVTELNSFNMGYIRALIGVGFSKDLGNLKLNGKVGYQIFVSQGLNGYEQSTDQDAALDGTLTNMTVGNRRSSFNTQLSLSKKVGKTRIGVFYEGEYFRTDSVRGFDGQNINVAPLGVQTPHRAGIRINF